MPLPGYREAIASCWPPLIEPAIPTVVFWTENRTEAWICPA
jgi:hypothetical protein